MDDHHHGPLCGPVRPSGDGICPCVRSELTVLVAMPRRAATCLVVHFSGSTVFIFSSCRPTRSEATPPISSSIRSRPDVPTAASSTLARP